MPPKRKTSRPRSYGRQARGKTIKSLSLDSNIVTWAEVCAAREGLSLSAWIESKLLQYKETRTTSRDEDDIALVSEQGGGYKAEQQKKIHNAAARTQFYSVSRNIVVTKKTDTPPTP